MSRLIRTAFSLALCTALITQSYSALEKTIAIRTETTLSADFLGFGVQWSPYPWFDLEDADWERCFRRLDYMRVPMVRVMNRAYYYCDGFDAAGKPLYNWNSNRMQKLYRLLDYCESRKIMVILGEWDSPATKEDRADVAVDQLQAYKIDETDPRWQRLIGDFLTHLLTTRGYTCVKYFNLINEPNGNWSGCGDYDKWHAAVKGLHTELAKRGLTKTVQIIGPDVTWQKDFHWLDRAVLGLSRELGLYDLHEYASFQDVESGWLEKVLRTKRVFIDRYDPAGRTKPFIMGEVGMGNRGPVAPQGGEDSHPKIYDHQYGVWMADYNIQCARAGMQGTIAWMLDDAMHIMNEGTGWPDISKTLFKKWGFWNSLAEEIGHPEDAALRPWFYTWSLFSRYFPRGSRIVQSSEVELAGVRSLAARIGDDDLTFALVNDSDVAQNIRLTVPGWKSKDTFKRFVYLPQHQPVDREGFPVAEALLPDVDLATGLHIVLPARSVIMVTTLEY